MHERERTEVLMVEWDKNAVLEVSCDVVSEVLKSGWGYRNTNWHKVFSSIKSAFDRNGVAKIEDSNSLLSVKLCAPQQFLVEGDSKSELPGVEAILAPIRDDSLKYVYWQRLGELSNLMKRISPYYYLDMPHELSLTFPHGIYAREVREFEAVVL